MSTPIIPADLLDLFESGVSILVGTRNASLVPQATRATGAVVHADRRRMTIFIPSESSGQTIANLEDNRLIAVGFSRTLDHKTMQVKGTVEEWRAATERDREVINRYHAAYSEVLAYVGLPRSLTRLWNVWPSIAVTFSITDIFSQTPGPGAGERFKATGA